MITHHPPFDLVVDYASGSLPEPIALAVACHAEMCRKCRDRIRELESVGGALLDAIEPVAISNRELEAAMARLDDLDMEEAVVATAPKDAPTRLPAALRRLIGEAWERLPWRKVGGLFQEARLPLGAEGYKVSLMRLKPGARMPRHTHHGAEYTLVLSGGYTDGGRAFLPGDFAAKDPSDEHKPVVDEDEECLCLVVQDAPVKLTGPLGRFVNPFLRA